MSPKIVIRNFENYTLENFLKKVLVAIVPNSGIKKLDYIENGLF